MAAKSRRKIAVINKETLRVCSALVEGRADKVTSARSWTDGKVLYIQGNPHAKRNEDGSYLMSFHGWRTKLTLSRLNGLFEILHGLQPFYLKRNGSAYLGNDSREIGPFEIITVPSELPAGFIQTS